MPRYRFLVHDGPQGDRGDEVELADVAAARVVAVRYLADLMRSDPRALWAAGAWRLEVSDDAGLVLFCVHVDTFDVAAGRG